MSLSSGKIAEVVFENFVETYEHQMLMLDLVDAESYDEAKLQNAGNTIWYPVQQHRPVLTGFDLTGQEQGIIEETYPISLQEPNNDLIEQRIDDVRDMRFWERAGQQAGYRQATELNKDISDLIGNTGSLYYEFDTSASKSGFDFISEAQALITERQVYKTMGCNFLLNPRDTQIFAQDLAGRQTVRGRPEDTWLTGQIGSNVAEFDVFTGSFTSNQVATTATTTTTAAVSEVPEGGTVDPITKVVTNVDYRRGSLPVTSSAAFSEGDVVTVDNAGTFVESVGLADKTASGQAMTFKVVGIPDASTLEVFPKPIALDDPALTELQKAYANIDTQITSGANVTTINTNGGRQNLFWAKDSIQVMGGEAPWQLMNEFGGMKVVSRSLTNGVTLYMVYDGDITKATFRYRLFVWYGLANRNPQANGSAVTF